MPFDLTKVHLSQRSREWLIGHTRMVPAAYVSPLNWAACWLEGTAAHLRRRPGYYASNSLTQDSSMVDAVTRAGNGLEATRVRLADVKLTTVSDTRAMYLSTLIPGTDYSVQLRRNVWVRCPVAMPTCMECLVELDKAMQRMVDKAGRWRDVNPDGSVFWNQWPLPPMAKRMQEATRKPTISHLVEEIHQLNNQAKEEPKP